MRLEEYNNEMALREYMEVEERTEDSFYGDSFPFLKEAGALIIGKMKYMQAEKEKQQVRNPIEYYKLRIKSEESMKEKLARKGLPITLEAALTKVFDGVGVRVICSFVDDVYEVIAMLEKQSDMVIIEKKDYIKIPKPNGYRSYHMIIKMVVSVDGKEREVFAEIQLRTIAMDCWASLEHQLKYKQSIKHQDMLVKELKRCADEMASTDMNLQTIRDLIEEAN